MGRLPNPILHIIKLGLKILSWLISIWPRFQPPKAWFWGHTFRLGAFHQYSHSTYHTILISGYIFLLDCSHLRAGDISRCSTKTNVKYIPASLDVTSSERSPPGPAVLNQGWFCSLRDIRQCLGHSCHNKRGAICLPFQWVEVRDIAKYPIIHRVAHHKKELCGSKCQKYRGWETLS